MAKKVRLKQALLKAGAARSMRDAAHLIHGKRVMVDAKIIKDTEFQLDPAKADVRVDDRRVSIAEPLYFLFNKPPDVTCQKGEHKNVYNLLDALGLPEEEKRSLFFIGRLDKETSGLMIATNDGGLAQRILRAGVTKEYHVVAKGCLPDADIRRLEDGVAIIVDGKRYTTRKAHVKNVAYGDDITSFDITIVEGKKRQIRLMLEAIGSKVLELERIAIGKLTQGGLNRGMFRKMERIEL